MCMFAIFVFTISSILSYLLFTNIYNAEIDVAPSGLIQLGDSYDQEEGIYAFFEQPNSLEVLKNVYSVLTSNNEYAYYEIMDNYVEYTGHYSLSPEFLVNQDNCNNATTGTALTPLLSLQLSKDVINDFGLCDRIIEGRKFEKEDFNLQGNKQVSVILGYNYKSYFNLGDSFNFNYLGANFNCRIIGFLDIITQLNVEELKYNLDDYIILPAFNECSLDDNDFEKILYSLKNSCYLKYTNAEQITQINEFVKSIRKNESYHIESYVLNPDNQLKMKFSIFNSFLYGNNIFLNLFIALVITVILLCRIVMLEKRFLKRSIEKNRTTSDVYYLQKYTKITVLFWLELIISYFIASFIYGIIFIGTDLKFLIQCSRCVAFLIFVAIATIYVICLKQQFHKTIMNIEDLNHDR